MTNYTNCYIAFLDILGFKELIKYRSCDELYNIFTTKMKKPFGGIHKGSKAVLDMKNVKLKVMSDSICFFVDSSVKNALFGLIITCMEFQNELMRMQPPVLCRGAIVKGDIFWDGDIIFGPGFVEAYKMEENNAKYPRIIMTRNTLDSAKDNTDEYILDDLSNRVFVDHDDFFTVNSLEVFEGIDVDGKDCRNLCEHITSVLGETVDNSVREKYLYLKKNLLRWYTPDDSN